MEISLACMNVGTPEVDGNSNLYEKKTKVNMPESFTVFSYRDCLGLIVRDSSVGVIHSLGGFKNSFRYRKIIMKIQRCVNHVHA